MRYNHSHNGIMDNKYSEARLKRPDIVYRYKMRARITIDAINRFVEKGVFLSLLDLGSADGLTLKEINSLTNKIDFYQGIECSDEIFLGISKLPSNINIIRGDIMNLSEYTDNRYFDVVTALCILEHLNDPYKALWEASNALRPRGIFIAVWPVILWDRIFMNLAPKGEKYHHVVNISPIQMSNMLKRVGLTPISHTKCLWLPFRFMSKSEVFNKYLLASFLRIEHILQNIKLLNWSFVCEVVIARKS